MSKKSDPGAVPFAGWTSDGWTLRTHTGYETTISGPRSAVVDDLRQSMPAWYRLAVGEGGSPELATMLNREADAMRIEVQS